MKGTQGHDQKDCTLIVLVYLVQKAQMIEE